MRYHETPNRTAKIEKTGHTKCGRERSVEDPELSRVHCRPESEGCSHFGKWFDGFSKSEAFSSHPVQQLDSCTLTRRKGDPCPHKDSPMDAYSGFICHLPKHGTIQMSIQRAAVCPRTGTTGRSRNQERPLTHRRSSVITLSERSQTEKRRTDRTIPSL